MDNEQKALSDAQIANAVEMSLARLRILIAALTTLRVNSDPQGVFSRDLLACCAFATDIHQWLAEQYLEANGATPGESRHLMQKILEAVGAVSVTPSDGSVAESPALSMPGDPTVH